MTWTREQWSRAFLSGLGNDNPSQNVLNWVINWTAAEGSDIGGQGDYNLLNTTQPMPGSRGGGQQGDIQYFTDFASGVQANDIVIKNGLYPDLLHALQTNDEKALGFGGSDPSSGVMHDLSIWCGGCNYGDWFASQKPSANWLGQLFPGDVNQSIPSGTTAVTSQLDTPSIISALGFPDAESIKNFFEQYVFVMFGIALLIVGIFVIFFSQKGDEDVAGMVSVPSD